MRHKTHYIVEYSGNTITAGDWAVWVRGDEKPGVSACTGAADIAVTAANEGTKDAGGLVREEEGVLRSNLLLLSVDDGRTETVLDHLMHCVPGPGIDPEQCVAGQTPGGSGTVRNIKSRVAD